MSVRNDDNIIKSLVILAIAAVFSVVMGVKTWLDEHGRK